MDRPVLMNKENLPQFSFEEALKYGSTKVLGPLTIMNIEDLPQRPPEETENVKRKRVLNPCEFGGNNGVNEPSGSALETKKPKSRRRSDADIERYYGSESSDSGEENEDFAPIMSPRFYLQRLDTSEDPKLETSAVLTSEPSEPSGLVKPVDLFDFEWRDFPDPAIPSSERRETFSAQNVGPTTPQQDPYSIFTHIWDESIMEHIANETNRYAQDLVSAQMENDKMDSCLSSWRNTCVDELYTYFAIILAMAVVVKDKVEEYWLDDEIFATPNYSLYMDLNRFKLLSMCLHFNDNSEMSELSQAEAKLFKINPIFKHLNRKFQEMYVLDQNIAIDETLLQWKGWSNLKQFRSAAKKVGIKTYELCEPQTGYIWRFIARAETKNVPQTNQGPLDTPTSDIVLELLNGLEETGYTVYMDTFYNSPALARHLKSIGFDVVGTLYTNRQFVPRKIAELTNTDMRPGEMSGFTSGDVDLMVWHKQNDIATISTYHGNLNDTITSLEKDKIKPCFIDYNIMMRELDKRNHQLMSYSVARKGTRVWYKKFFLRLLNVSVVNSLIIARKSSGSKIDDDKFRIDLVNALLERHNKPQSPVSGIFEAKNHYPMKYPMGANKSRLRRSCCVCKKLTRYYCVGCEKTLCLGSCFATFHS